MTARCDLCPGVAFELEVSLTGAELQRLAAGPEFVTPALSTAYRAWLQLPPLTDGATGEAQASHAATQAEHYATVETEQAAVLDAWYALLSRVYGQRAYDIGGTTLDLSTPETVKALLNDDNLDLGLRAWLIKAPAAAMQYELERIGTDLKESFRPVVTSPTL